MFIVFEGIDGSGKTTISNRVSDRLRRAGTRVTHVREEGTFRSAAAQAIRELGRDARNLMLSPISELLLYVARDAQSLEEMVVPALATSDVVIADRCLYSAELLATAGRGVPASLVQSIVAPILARAVPDLCILIDVPPDIARARRRVSKLLAPDKKPSSRKGLTGGGLQVRMREAHLAMARQKPEQWLIVDNDDVDLDAVVEMVTVAIQTAMARGVAAGIAEGRKRQPPRRWQMPSGVATADDARATLLSWVEHRAAREPHLAAYVLGGLTGDDVDRWRWKLADRSPVIIAAGLSGLDDAAAWRLREHLADRAVDGVVRSLSGIATEQAYRHRRALAAVAPEAVASSLGGLDDDEAWALRDRLHAVVPDAIAGSLAHLTSARADAERRAWLEMQPPDGPITYLQAKAGARMVAGRDDDLAWQIRELVFGLAPVEAIAGLRGEGERTWAWRERFAERAPKPIAESLVELTSPQAWRMRERLAGVCREVFGTMQGLDGPEAWALRECHADTWPSTVVKSLGPLSDTPRGEAFVAKMLAEHPGVSMLRNAAREYPLAPAGDGAAREGVTPLVVRNPGVTRDLDEADVVVAR